MIDEFLAPRREILNLLVFFNWQHQEKELAIEDGGEFYESFRQG